MNSVLGIDDFFYVADKSYDDLAEKSLPYYHEAHELLIESVAFPRDASIDVIDLGIGTGVTSAYILRNFPCATVLGVDLFDAMLDDARIRLKSFGTRVQFVQGDNLTVLQSLKRQVHVIVSAFCIHHQSPEAKQELFREIHDHLLPGGQFLMLDWTTFQDPHLAELARRAAVENLEASVTDADYRDKWLHHWTHINQPSPADDMVRWFRNAGFTAEIVMRNLGVALVVARTSNQ